MENQQLEIGLLVFWRENVAVKAVVKGVPFMLYMRRLCCVY